MARKKLKFYRNKKTDMSFYKSEAKKSDYVNFFVNRGLQRDRLLCLSVKTLRLMFINCNRKDAGKALKELKGNI